jgi:drug/metabolite transporter (DMT)-like permease
MAGTAFLWSIAGLFIKVIDWNPFHIACARSLIASVFILAIMRNVQFKWSSSFVLAAIANACTMILFVTANKTTTAANAIVLQYTAPAITLVFSGVFLNEKIRNEHILSVIFIIGGIVIMFLDKLTMGSLLGNLLAMASAFTFSIFLIFMRKEKGGSPLGAVLLSHILAVIICFGISLFLTAPHITTSSILAVLVLGIFQIGIASILLSMAIKKISAVTANLIAVIEPVFNPIWVFLILGEKFRVNTLIGGGMIIGSILFTSLITLRKNRANSTE